MTYTFMQVDARTLDLINRSRRQMMTVEAAERGIRRLIKVCLTRHQFSALVSFLISVGADEFLDSDVYRLTNEGKHKEAAEAFLSHTKDSSGNECDNMSAMRRYERAIYLSPVVIEYKAPKKGRKK